MTQIKILDFRSAIASVNWVLDGLSFLTIEQFRSVNVELRFSKSTAKLQEMIPNVSDSFTDDHDNAYLALKLVEATILRWKYQNMAVVEKSPELPQELSVVKKPTLTLIHGENMSIKPINKEDLDTWTKNKEVEYASRTVSIDGGLKRLRFMISMDRNYRVTVANDVVYDGGSLNGAISEYNSIK